MRERRNANQEARYRTMDKTKGQGEYLQTILAFAWQSRAHGTIDLEGIEAAEASSVAAGAGV